MTQKYFSFVTPNIYLHGHRFDQLVSSQAFRRIGDYLGHGLCYETAAMAMLSLRSERSARLVHGYASGRKGRTGHAWVEFKMDGEIYVISPTWLDDLVIPRALWYDEDLDFLPDERWACSYREFWNYPASKRLYGKITNPDTSYILGFLLCYRPITRFGGARFGFAPNDTEFHHSVRNALLGGLPAIDPDFFARPLCSEIIEDLCFGAKPSVESLSRAWVRGRIFAHRVLR